MRKNLDRGLGTRLSIHMYRYIYLFVCWVPNAKGSTGSKAPLILGVLDELCRCIDLSVITMVVLDSLLFRQYMRENERVAMFKKVCYRYNTIS